MADGYQRFTSPPPVSGCSAGRSPLPKTGVDRGAHQKGAPEGLKPAGLAMAALVARLKPEAGQ